MSVLIVPTLALVVVWIACMWVVLSTGRCLSPLTGWMVGLSFFVVLPLVIIVLNGGYSVPSYYGVTGNWGSLDLSDSRYLLPYFFVWTNLILVALTAGFLGIRRAATAQLYAQFAIKDSALKWAVLACAALTVLDLSVNIYLRGGIFNYFVLNWYTRSADSLAAFGDAYVLYLFLTLGLQLTLTATACLCIVRKMHSGKGGWLLSASLGTMTLNMVASGNRIFFALLLLFFGAQCIYERRYRAIVKTAFMAPILVVAFAVWAQVRGSLADPIAALNQHIESATAYEGNYFLNRLLDATEGTNIIFLLNITKDYGERYQYLAGLTILKAVTFWVPRSIYPEKPDSFPVITARLYEPGEETSISSTVIGELYANFGYFTIVLMPFLTAVIFAVDCWISRRLTRNLLLCTALFLIFAWMARATFSDNLVMLGFAVFLIWALRLQSGLLVTRGTPVSADRSDRPQLV